MAKLNQLLVNVFVNELKFVKYVGILEALGLEYITDSDQCPHLYLRVIKIKKKYRNLGYGTEVMTEIVKYANLHKLPVRLFAVTLYGSDMDRLIKFYQRFGFEMNIINEEKMFIYTPKKD